MSTYKPFILLVCTFFLSITPVYAATDTGPNLGQKMSAEEIGKWSITVFSDGTGLPAGQGNASDGEKLYEAKCIACHGKTGVEGPATRLVGPPGPDASKGPLAALSVGAWPYATTIFDFVRRAMPHNAPKSLSNDQVYQLTAYILYLNQLVEKDETINAKNLPEIKMPYADKIISQWETE